MVHLILIILISYLAGSIPTAIIVSKYFYHKDVRQHGSKNAGATNVFRVLGWKPGLGVLLFDMFKGVAATVWIAHMFTVDLNIFPVYVQMIAGASAVIGHIWTIFAGFKGGKGVATGAGMLIGLAPWAVLICLAVFVLLFIITRMVSVGSISAAVTFPVVIFFERFLSGQNIPFGMLIFSILVAVLIIYTHRANIGRILKGTENKISFNKKGS